MSANTPAERKPKQLLHLVFGGELTRLDAVDFADISKLDIVGIFPNYAEAQKAWKAAAQRSVDQAQTRYFIVHLHRLLDPDASSRQS
jgi:hypothetical protein